MYDRILVPTDGSQVATTAAEAALSLATVFDAELHIISIVEPEPFPGFDEVTDEIARLGKNAVSEMDERATESGVDVTTALIDDEEPVHRAILDYGDDHDIDLVVMGTHGRKGLDRVILGSVAEQTLRLSSIPVMTVHGDTVVNAPFESILVPVDGSASAESAVDHAVDLAETTDATVQFVNVVDPAVMTGELDSGMIINTLTEAGEQLIERATENAESAGVDVGASSVLVGSPFRKIVEFSEEQNADCLVMGTQGRTGVGRVLLGSVAERVIRKTDVPVIATKAVNADE